MDNQDDVDSNSGSGPHNTFPLTVKYVGFFLLRQNKYKKCQNPTLDLWGMMFPIW